MHCVVIARQFVEQIVAVTVGYRRRDHGQQTVEQEHWHSTGARLAWILDGVTVEVEPHPTRQRGLVDDYVGSVADRWQGA